MHWPFFQAPNHSSPRCLPRSRAWSISASTPVKSKTPSSGSTSSHVTATSRVFMPSCSALSHAFAIQERLDPVELCVSPARIRKGLPPTTSVALPSMVSIWGKLLFSVMVRTLSSVVCLGSPSTIAAGAPHMDAPEKWFNSWTPRRRPASPPRGRRVPSSVYTAARRKTRCHSWSRASDVACPRRAPGDKDG